MLRPETIAFIDQRPHVNLTDAIACDELLLTWLALCGHSTN